MGTGVIENEMRRPIKERIFAWLLADAERLLAEITLRDAGLLLANEMLQNAAGLVAGLTLQDVVRLSAEF
jgi:hypothetical protein